MSTKEQSYDVIVVGGGIGGLSAAAHLAQKGKKVLCLEKHNLPGGSSSSFVRGRFEFEPSLHEMAQIGPESNPGEIRKLFNDLGAPVDFVVDEQLYRVISIDKNEPYDCVCRSGRERFYDDVEKAVPGSRESVKQFIELGAKAMASIDEISKKGVNPFNVLSKHGDFLRLSGHTVNEVMDLLGMPKKAQHIVATYWPYVGEPTESMDCMSFLIVLVTYIDYAGGMPSEFSHELSLALDYALRLHGGRIWYNAEVTQVLVEKGRVKGVVVNGQTLYCNHIICNAYPNHLFGHLMDLKEVPEIELKKANARGLGLSFVNIYLGLNRTKDELGIKDYTIFLQGYSDSKEQLDHMYSFFNDGVMVVNCMNVANPNCSPKGTAEFSITLLVYDDIWASVKPQDYKKTKYNLAEQAIDYVEKALNLTLKPYIEEIEVATPVTFARYLNTPNGTPYGYRLKYWDGMIARGMNPRKELTIKGLDFVGAFAERADGYSSVFNSGIIAANRVAEDLAKEGK